MREFSQLTELIKILRNPIRGCPWDLVQSQQSLKEYILEEAYELVEAIEHQSCQQQQEEMGDLLLQIVFLAQIHKEKNHFSIRDVIRGIVKKLIDRHPHVFKDKKTLSEKEIKANWQQSKIKENKNTSIISDYPDKIPSLQTAKRISEQASSVGFDWGSASLALTKVEEEMQELKEEIVSGQKGRIAEEIGDLFFALANVSRLLNINPEIALKKANKKFTARFRLLEKKIAEFGQDINQIPLDELEALWQKVKKP